MKNYVGKIIQVAGEDGKGAINDHVGICPSMESLLTSLLAKRVSEREWSTSRCSCYLRKDYSEKVEGQPDGRRGYSKIEDICKDKPYAEALETATQHAKTENVVLYQQINMRESKILWHPDGWEPIYGKGHEMQKIKNAIMNKPTSWARKLLVKKGSKGRKWH
ncbi:hypothetical protein JXA85_06605 [Candidatus Woesearchaeota archaeon]|nr:hypothetical protein [Candidatus Woesearchaeota archaeon]